MEHTPHIWFDIEIPKSVLFFKPIIDKLEERGEQILITARSGEGYSELQELLELYYPNHKIYYIGSFGGASKKGKLLASNERQLALIMFLENFKISKLVTLCSVDATRVAFGLGIKVINFYDIPLSDHKENFKKALPQAKLTIPLSEKVFKPFVVPDNIFKRFSLEEDQIVSYNFIDPLIWLTNLQINTGYAHEIIQNHFDDTTKPLIIIREEEYKASYVDKKYPILYEALHDIYDATQANILIIPRYESEYLKEEFPFAKILEYKCEIQHLLALCDLFIGGGGTINTEACFLGTPTISTRSFVSHYDKYQIDHHLMVWVESKEELVAQTLALLGNRVDTTSVKKMSIDLEHIVQEIIDVS